MKYCMKHLQDRKISLYCLGGVFMLLSAVLGLLLGATPLSISQLFHGLVSFDSADGTILWFVRLPRVLAGLLCGSALAVSGAVIQNVLANRLASPGIIGVNAGAGLAVTLCAALGLLGGWQMSLFAFLGAFATVMTVSLGAKRWGASRGTVILMGVAVNSLLGAFSDAVTALAPQISIMRADFKIGDLSGVTYTKLLPAAVVILAALLLLLTLRNELDVLALGDDTAKSLGMNTSTLRTLFLILAAALSGAAVSLVGLLSFVGLLVPHAVRRFAGNEARYLIALCALFGAGFVTLCDTLARCLFAPYELPVGILMALIGAPFFLMILIKGKGGHRNA